MCTTIYAPSRHVERERELSDTLSRELGTGGHARLLAQALGRHQARTASTMASAVSFEWNGEQRQRFADDDCTVIPNVLSFEQFEELNLH